MMFSHARRFTLLAVLGLACFSGCAQGLMGGRSLFADVPGTDGPMSDEEIKEMAARDSWQPGSPFTVTTGQNAVMR